MNRGGTSSTRVVVFDIDDTVYLERQYVRSGFAAVGTWAEQHGFAPGFGEACWDAFEAGARGRIFDSVFASRGIRVDPSIIATLIEIYRTHAPEISILPDALDCLVSLAPRVNLAVVSDGPLESQRAKARVLELSTWFEPIVFTAELGTGFSKPSPRGFQLVQESLGDPPGAYAYVADNPSKDFAGPHSLGWRTVRVRRPGSLHEMGASGSDVDDEVEDLHRLPAVLEIA